MAVVMEEIDEAEKKTYNVNSQTTPKRETYYWQYLKISFFRRNETRHKVKAFVNYCVLPMAMIALFSGAILVQPGRRNSGDLQNKTEKSPNSKKGNGIKISKCVSTNLELNCTGINFNDGPEELLQELERYIQQVRLKLRLTNCVYKNNGIEKGWLPVKENVHPIITGITFDGPQFMKMGDESFSNLRNIESFTLVNVGLTYLKRSMFKGLSQVWEFNLRNNPYLREVEEGLLQDFPGLKTFQLQGMLLANETTSLPFFQNLTGPTNLPSVLTVDLTENVMWTLRKAFIEKFTGATQIYVYRSEIHYFEPNALEVLTNHKTPTILDLSFNQIEIFPQETFEKIIQNSAIKLKVDANPIFCNCSMKWLKNYQNPYNNTDEIFFECKSPPPLHGESLFDVDFCQNEDVTPTTPTTFQTPSTTPELPTPTTTSSEVPTSAETEPTTSELPTTPPTEIPTTQDPPSTTTETPAEQVCKNAMSQKVHRATTSVYFSYKIEEITSSNGTFHLEISTKENSTVLAFSDGSSNEIRCQTISPQSSKVSVANVSHNTDYLFCFYDANQTDTGLVTFRDCLSYKTTSSPEDQPWLTHKEKALTIVYIVCGLIGTFLMGGILAFCVVRKVPTLLRGSERVEIVKSRNGETVLIMPERREPPAAQSEVYETISGYVSNGEFYERRNPPPLPPYPAEFRRGMEEHEYLEPRYMRKAPRNADYVMEYGYYTGNKWPGSNRTSTPSSAQYT